MWFVFQDAIILAVSLPIIEWHPSQQRPAVMLGFIVAFGATVAINVLVGPRRPHWPTGLLRPTPGGVPSRPAKKKPRIEAG